MVKRRGLVGCALLQSKPCPKSNAALMDDSEVRVLVVDDVQDAAEALACALQADGYTVLTAHDGATALSLIETFLPHCVLLDIDMPTMGGHELASRLRLRFGDAVVLIAVTGWGRADDRFSQAFELFDHYLRKPFDTAVLHKILPPLD